MWSRGRSWPSRLLLVDNYDSYTHNLAQLLASLTGTAPTVVRNDALSLDEWLAHPPDAVVLSPGPGTPDHAADIGICRALVERLTATPILGVCLGHQVIGAACGARVERAPAPAHGRVSPVRHDGSGLFRGLPSPLGVVRYHSLVVAADSLPAVLRPTAFTDDGLLMALEHRERPLWGVQFHPESILTEQGRALLANFLDLAARQHSVTSLQYDIAAMRYSNDASRHNNIAMQHDAAASGSSRPISRSARVRPPTRLHVRELPWIDPERAFLTLFRDAPQSFWLDGTGRYSYMGACGRELLRATSRRCERITPSGVEPVDGDPFAVIDEWMSMCNIVHNPEWPFQAGYVGWLGYELKEHCEGGEGPRRDDALPDALFMRADRVLAFDHQRRVLRLTYLLDDEEDERDGERWCDSIAERLRTAPTEPPPQPDASRRSNRVGPRFRLARPRARYLADVARIHEHLLDGETYEICLTVQAEADAPADFDPLALHRVLRRSNPAPWSSYLRFPGGAIVSASPERFVHIDADGLVESRPIKGTRRRGADPIEDERLRAELAQSEKDRAENLMIVDLVRNDLGRVCAAGSVVVPSLMQVEAHPTVFQLVSTVRGRLRPEVRPLEAVRALFPGGSMTGAPKIRAMRIIAELEGAPRGVYSGGIGYLGFDGAVDLAMAIRTVVVREQPGAIRLSFGVGGAVVALSDAEAEFDEALAKGEALLRAMGGVIDDANGG